MYDQKWTLAQNIMNLFGNVQRQGRPAGGQGYVAWRGRVVWAGFLLFFFAKTVLAASWEETDGVLFAAGDIAAVKRLLSEHEGYSASSMRNDALFYTIDSGQLPLLKYLASIGWLESCRADENCRTSVTTYAVFRSDQSVAMLRYLDSQQFPLTHEALTRAAESGDLAAVKFLCQRGVDPRQIIVYDARYDPQLKSGMTRFGNVLMKLMDGPVYQEQPFYSSGDPSADARYAVKIIEVAEFLEKGRCSKGARYQAGADTYDAEARLFREAEIEKIRKRYSVSKKTLGHPRVRTYFIDEAVVSGSVELLAYLKSLGWVDECKRKAYCQPMAVAAYSGAGEDVFRFLLAEGFALDAYDVPSSGATPLHYAVRNAQENAVKFLCQQGANPRQPVVLFSSGDSLLKAVRKGYANVWCELNGDRSDAAKAACDPYETDFVGPYDCMPGAACLSLAFPPQGPREKVQRLERYSEIFHYLRDGRCSKVSAGQCDRAIKPGREGEVVVERLKVRSAPGVLGASLGALHFGDYFSVLEVVDDCVLIDGKHGRWIRIHVRSPREGEAEMLEGWVFDAYVDYLPLQEWQKQ